ncbi:MAG: FAD-binding protein [Chitinophagaceae bacterium]|nr:FAD-binding protein [Chitinophagaceae bacterium]
MAIKSGGHCMEGYSVNEGGMCINLSQLNQILWLNKNTIQVGPGCTLSRIYDEILPKGKYLPGGSCAGVGIGGLVLGGGYGLMGRKFGLTCDSLLELTMVDGSGNIHKAAPGDELLWACKGGGNGNFGVVTGLTFKLHEAPKLMQSHRFKIHNTDPARAITALQKWFGLVSDLPNECFSAFVLNRKTVYILLTNASGSNTAIQKTITALSAITDKTTHTSAKPLATALKVFYGRPDPLHFKNASAGLYKGFDDIASCIEKVIPMVMASPGMIYQVNTLGGNIRNPEFEKLSSFPHRAYPYFSELQTYWETESQEPQRIKRFREVQSLFNNSGIVAQYRNYPDNDFTQWERLYYGGNYNRLQQIKNKYDPRNLFRYEQSIKNT